MPSFENARSQKGVIWTRFCNRKQVTQTQVFENQNLNVLIQIYKLSSAVLLFGSITEQMSLLENRKLKMFFSICIFANSICGRTSDDKTYI